MRKILLNAKPRSGVTIMVFTEGTILQPKSWWSLFNHKSYIPIGKAADIIQSWQQQGANIIYCTSRKKKEADDVASLLMKYGFSGTFLVAREYKESYKDIVEKLQPNILIEDDCKSIGGAWQMCLTKVNPEINKKIVSIVVQEFKGIDHISIDSKSFKKV